MTYVHLQTFNFSLIYATFMTIHIEIHFKATRSKAAVYTSYKESTFARQ